MSDVYDTAFKLLTLGFSVIPSGGGDKHKAPLVPWQEYQARKPTDTEIDHWQQELNPRLFGIVTGTNSGLVVLDADTAEARKETEKLLGAPHVITPRGGGHWYFKHPGHRVKTVAGLLPSTDIRGDGGFVNVCGQRPDGEYKILTLPTPDNLLPWDKLPLEVKTAMESDGHKKMVSASVGETIPEGQRNDRLTSLAGTMRQRGMAQSAIEAGLLEMNKTQCEPPLPEQEVRRIARSIAQYEPKSDREHFKLTDLGNAERLVNQHGHILHYCYERNKWLIWEGKVWEWDSGAKIQVLAKLTVRNIYNEAADEPDEKIRKAIADHARHSESDHRLTAMINVAQSEPGIPVKVTALDTNPWLFSCLNGTIDLRTGELLPHREEDLLTIVVPIEYHHDARCERWLSFLDQTTDGNIELQGYLQRAVGYSLTGDTKSQVLFFLYGLGNNGKSTFVMTIRKLAGGYGERVNTELFMMKDKNTGGPKEGLANLKGKRYVVASELEDGRRLAVSLIKDMTGGETIKADRKYEHEIEYQPTHKLWLVGNHKPVIPDTTLSIWRRVKLIPFTVTIPDSKIDPDLPLKLEAELPGILTWAIKGCLDWQRYGLKEPSTVTIATRSYCHEQDILGDFLEDCCILEPLTEVAKSNLKDEYERWCQENITEPVGQRTFKARLIEKGITEGKSGPIRYWKGITLRSLVPNEARNVPHLDTNGTTGIENSGDFLYEEKQEKFIENPVPDVPMSQNGNIPDYPTSICPRCGCDDYWLLKASQWGKAEWLCARCHPEPSEEGRE